MKVKLEFFFFKIFSVFLRAAGFKTTKKDRELFTFKKRIEYQKRYSHTTTPKGLLGVHLGVRNNSKHLI